MVEPVQLALVEKDCLLRIGKVRPVVEAGEAQLDSALYLCTLYRRIALCRLFVQGRPEGFFAHLVMSGQAYVAFLNTCEDSRKRTGKSVPWLDALAGHDRALAAEISAASLSTFREGEEYEVDFLYYRYLMLLTSGLRERELEDLLNRYAACLDGDDDPRMNICQALYERDSDTFNEALASLMQSQRDNFAELHAADRLDPDVFATTAKVSIEGLALAAIADEREIPTLHEYLLIPAVARLSKKASLLARDAWLTR